MKKEYEILFTPTKIGSCELKNRFVMEPMEGTSMLNGMMGQGYQPAVHDLLVERAKDGVGLIIPGAIFISSLLGHTWMDQEEMFEGVKETVDEIHKYGSKIFFQISASVGRNFTLTKEMADHFEEEDPKLHLSESLVSASDGLPDVWVPERKVRALTKDEIHEIIDHMANAAWLAKKNGVDGIDVHAVHEGYLIDQFATPYTNDRDDEYGGSLENRLRFACEVVKAIKAKCGEDYPVILRYSVTSRTKGWNHGIIPADDEAAEIGRTLEESEKAIQILSEAGYDAFNADNGTYDAWYYAHPPVYMPLNCNLKESEHVKPFTDKPIICAGRMQLDEAAESIRNGRIDMVGIARQFLTEPEYLTKIREDRLDEIKPCISCHVGCFPVGLWKDSGAVFDFSKPTGICALNPYTRNEKKYRITPAENPKDIAVIGGGVAGMEFALKAAAKGHKVTLYEKSNRLGGVFNEASSFTFKEKDRDLLDFYRRQIENSPVGVKYETEITDLNDLPQDDIVIATGAASTRQLAGAEGKAISALDFLKENPETGENVVIIGGGLTGCEIAYELAMQGKKVSIVEMQDDILKAPGSCMANTSYLRDAFDFYGVDVYRNAKVSGINDDSVDVITEDGSEISLPKDLCIYSIGYNHGIPFDLEKTDKRCFTIGDANKVANLMNAVWGANDLVVEEFK